MLYTPGWDCHGLPIELKALQASGADSAYRLPALELRAAAAACATEAMALQQASFERWGVMADWAHPYNTMQPKYEAAQLGVLGTMQERGCAPRHPTPPYPNLILRHATPPYATLRHPTLPYATLRHPTPPYATLILTLTLI